MATSHQIAGGGEGEGEGKEKKKRKLLQELLKYVPIQLKAKVINTYLFQLSIFKYEGSIRNLTASL